MKETLTEKDDQGKVEFLRDFDRHLFRARPHGMINPNLIAKDLEEARKFSSEVEHHWTYTTDTTHLKLANPLNLLWLKDIKKLPKLREIVVFAPAFYNRLLLRLASPIVRPDRIIVKRSEYESFLSKVH